MKKKPLLPIVMGVVSLALAVASFLLLPDTVITQFSAGGSGVSTMPKALAVALPTLLGAGGAAYSLFSGGTDSGKGKALLVSAVGIAVFVLMLLVNL